MTKWKWWSFLPRWLAEQFYRTDIYISNLEEDNRYKRKFVGFIKKD